MASSHHQRFNRPVIINVLITSFPGLGLPSTVSLPVPATASVSDVTALFASRIPQTGTRLILTTTSNEEISQSSQAPIIDLLCDDKADFLPLRLSVPLCGGKGGFGSQLRAAGGRMSSRRKKNQAENNGSSRNLDGRRLRTVAEAKSLAEYLATKPNMEKREKEAKRKGWEEVIELTERRQEELKNGTKAKIDAKWVEERDEAVERVRRVTLASMASRESLKPSSGNASEWSSDRDSSGTSSTSPSASPSKSKPKEAKIVKCFGWDDVNESMSDSDEEGDGSVEDSEGEDEPTEVEMVEHAEVVGKGKGKA